MNKVNITVKKQVKVDGRSNNTGRPVNKKSARQVRLAKQALYNKLHTAFINGKKFKINNNNTEYMYKRSDDNKDTGCIVNSVGMYVCNINYVGRTKVTGFTYVLGKRVNIEINLKEVTFA